MLGPIRGDLRINTLSGRYHVQCFRETCAFFQNRNLVWKSIGTRPDSEKAMELVTAWIENFGGRFVGFFDPSTTIYSGGKE